METSANSAKLRKSNIMAKATLALAFGVASVSPSGSYENVPQNRIGVASAAATQECIYLSQLMYRASPFDYSITATYANIDNVSKILDKAEDAAGKLNIPKEFVIAHWAMESGILNLPNFNAISNNNLAGISEGIKLKHFNSLDDFVEEYVATLKHAGVDKIPDSENATLLAIMDKLDRKHYSELTEGQYLARILGIANVLKDINPKYMEFYEEGIRTRSILNQRNTKLLALKRNN